MALIDLKSDLTWYGSPPAYDGAQNPQGVSSTNEHQTGFTPGRKHLDETEFTGVSGQQFNRPNVFSTVLGFTDNWINTDASGFTPSRKHLDATEFTGVTGAPGAFQFNRPGIPNTIIGAYDGAFNPSGPPSSNVDQAGFTIGRQPLGRTEFTGVTGTSPNLFFNRPTIFNTVLGRATFFPDSDAVGFTLGRRTLDPTEFTGVKDTQFNRPDVANTVLGAGKFPFMPDKYEWNPIHIGYTPKNKYSSIVNRLETKGLADTYTTNSPIDDMYNKFVVRDEAFNPIGYAREPFILRGIQRPGKTKNQRWGFGVNFDDGFIRGGIVTATERLLFDTLRIGKWLIKPKGILWMVKQFGLQQSNPTYESLIGTPGMPLAQMNKIWTPINTLVNVATNAIGLHFPRHGILPVPTLGRYEDIFKLRKAPGFSKKANRLIKTAYGPAGLFTLAGFGQPVGIPILNLLNLNGPNSLYGIPGTSTLMIGPKRATNTSLAGQLSLSPAGHDPGIGTFSDYTKLKQYTGTSLLPAFGMSAFDSIPGKYSLGVDPAASDLSEMLWSTTKKGGPATKQVTQLNLADSTHPFTVPASTKRIAGLVPPIFGGSTPSNGSPYGFYIHEDGWQYRFDKPYMKAGLTYTNFVDIDAEVTWLRDKSYWQSRQLEVKTRSGVDVDPIKIKKTTDTPAKSTSNSPVPPPRDIQRYASVAYGQIPGQDDPAQDFINSNTFHDFRADIDTMGATETPFIGDAGTAAYIDNNIHTIYGIPNSGKVGADRTDFNTSPEGLSDIINKLEPGADLPANTKDLIKFKFQTGTAPLIFRAFITSYSDNMSPSYTSGKLLGDVWGLVGITSLTRNISLSFTVAPSSREELLPLWKKTDRLAQYALPTGTGEALNTQQCSLTVGNLVNEIPCFLSDFSIDIDNETIWDLKYELPMHWNIDVSFDVYPKAASVSSGNAVFNGLDTAVKVK